MRGKRNTNAESNISGRITPADAGKTPNVAFKVKGNMDHPRGCGENFANVRFNDEVYGSPPRMRGKLLQFYSSSTFDRITPADAGKTQFFVLAPRRDQDHPRGCGENHF